MPKLSTGGECIWGQIKKSVLQCEHAVELSLFPSVQEPEVYCCCIAPGGPVNACQRLSGTSGKTLSLRRVWVLCAVKVWYGGRKAKQTESWEQLSVTASLPSWECTSVLKTSWKAERNIRSGFSVGSLWHGLTHTPSEIGSGCFGKTTTCMATANL